MNKRRIKILRIITRLNVGGPARHVVILTKELNDETFQSYLVIGKTEPNEGDMVYLSKKEDGVHPIVIPEMKRSVSLVNDWISFWKIFILIRRIKPDIVHTHTSKAGLLGRWAAKLAGVPYIVHTYHGHVFSGYFGRGRTIFYLWLNRLTGLITNKVIVISKAVKEDICEKFKVVPQANVDIVPLGIETAPFIFDGQVREDFRKTIGVKEKDVLIVFVGRLIPIKNCDMLMQVARRAVESFSQVKFLVVGDGEIKNAMQMQVHSSRLEEKIIFLGWQSKVAPIYAASDLCVLTSLNEGTPLGLIEAMLSGKPVIATDVGGVRDVVQEQETGFLVPSGDVEGFMSKLSLLIKDEALRLEMGKKAKAIAFEKYDSKKLTANMKEIYSTFALY